MSFMAVLVILLCENRSLADTCGVIRNSSLVRLRGRDRALPSFELVNMLDKGGLV
jgi:hypothetical protein